MNLTQIQQILPHRPPMLLVEEVNVNEDGSATGYYTVKGTEYFLQGHFPGNPIVPGVILCEMVSQASCVLFAGMDVKGKTPMLTGINNVKFRAPVKVGDKIELHCTITRSKGPFYFLAGSASVDGKQCMRGEFSFAIV